MFTNVSEEYVAIAFFFRIACLHIPEDTTHSRENVTPQGK
jgi:hypothetical protein